MAYVGALLPNINRQFTDANGVPLAHGSVESFVTGLDVPKPLYAESTLVTPLANPAELDADGRLTAFMTSGGYDFDVYDEDEVLLYTVAGVEDYGATFLGTLGNQLNSGARSVTSGYTVLATDLTITVNSTGGANPCIVNLPTAASHPQPLTVKNAGTIALSVVPYGTETLELGAAGVAYSVPAASSPSFPTISMTNDGVSAWVIYGSHKCP